VGQMEENKNSKFSSFIIVVLVISLVISFLMINNLRNQVDNLESKLNQQTELMNSQINSIYSNVDEKLKKQTSLLSEFSYKNGKFFPERKTAELIIEFVPKVITDDTSLYVTFDGKETPCVKNKNKYTAVLTVNAFKYHDEQPVLNIKTSTETKTEILEDIYIEYLYTNHLGSLNAHSTLNGIQNKYDITKPANTKTISYNGSVYFDYWKNAENNSSNTIKKAFITIEINNKELKRYDVTNKLVLSEENLIGDVSLTETFNVKLNDNIEFFAIVEDSYGFIHKCLVHKQTISEKDEDFYEFSSEEIIYDQDNNKLN
jgi:hypothetical protein